MLFTGLQAYNGKQNSYYFNVQAGHSQFQLSDNVFKIQSSVPLVHCTMQTTKSML